MFRQIRRFVSPLTLSRAIEIAGAMHGPDSQTWRWYSTPVNQLIQQIGDVPVHQVRPGHINDWYAWISTNGYSAWTVDSYTRALKSFFNRMIDAGHLDESPAAHLRLYKLPKKSPKDIRPGDIQLMLKHARYNARDYAIIRVLYDTGCRVGEMISMTTDGLRFGPDGGRAIVRGSKVHKTRFVFFGLETADAIRVYLDCRPWNAPGELWLSHRDGKPITPNAVYQMMRRVAKSAGVEGRFNPHAFRHAAIKRWIDSGMPLKVVQELAGHDQIETTMGMYAVYDDDELAAQFKRYTQRPGGNAGHDNQRKL